MGKAFFKPYIGKNYEKGILGKRILVIGASFYCNKTDCPFFNDCTSLEKKDSSKYNEKCWCTERKDIKLENEPSSSISEWSRTYRNFENLFKGILPDGESAYDYYAFTNFVQYFLPAKNGYRPTYPSDISPRDLDAFHEVVLELKPNIIITWGNVIVQALRENNPRCNMSKCKKTDYYISDLKLDTLDMDVHMLHIYHPSSPAYHFSLDIAQKYFNQLLGE